MKEYTIATERVNLLFRGERWEVDPFEEVEFLEKLPPGEQLKTHFQARLAAKTTLDLETQPLTRQEAHQLDIALGEAVTRLLGELKKKFASV